MNAFSLQQKKKSSVFTTIFPLVDQVVKKLQRRYGNIYGLENVVLSGTHTHGTPGGFMMHLLYDMSTFGFVPETYRALVFGIFRVSVCVAVSITNLTEQ